MGMTRILRLFSIVAIGGFFALNTSCTRSLPENVQLKIAVPNSLSSLGGVGTLANEKLEMVVLNLRASAGAPPVVMMFEAGRNLPSGLNLTGSFVLTVPGERIPTSKATIIQFIGVYKDDAGKMIFSYGDTTVNTDVTGIIPADIASTVFSTTGGQQVKFGGRYLTGTNAGPTGSLLTYFQPPDAAKPLVAVERSEMIDGYFSAFAIEGSAGLPPMFTYKVLDHVTKTETPIWTNVNSSSAMFTSSDPNSNINSFVMEGPIYSRDQKDGRIDVRVEAGGWFYAGNWAFSTLDLTNTGATVSTTIMQSIDRLSLDANGLQPYAYDYYNALSAVPSLSHVSGNTDASTGAPNLITFYPDRVDNHGSQAFGFNGVFEIVNQSEKYEGAFLKARRNAANSVDLMWDYLPISATLIDGAEIYYKYEQFGGGDNGGGDMSLDVAPSCANDLMRKGFKRILGKETILANASINITATADGLPFTQDYGHRFAVCPFKTVAGQRIHYRTFATTSCFGSCGDYQAQFSFGKKVPAYSPHDLTILGGAMFDSGTIGGASGRIQSVTNNLDGTFNLTDTANSNISVVALPGDEIYIKVMGMNTSDSTPGASACGTSSYGPIGAYNWDTAIVTATSTDVLTVKPMQPNLLAGISNTSLTNLHTSSDFCYIQMVRVPHFGNVTLSSSSSIHARPFQWDEYGGGIVAMRINGILDMGAEGNFVDVSSTGYPAGTGPRGAGGGTMSGAGKNATSFDAGSGAAGAWGSGGAGQGAAATIPGGSVWNNPNDMMGLKMDFGYGGGDDGDGFGTWGKGGGLIMIMARQVLTRGNGNYFESMGQMGGSPSIKHAGGGGGGGSINLYSIKVSNGDGNILGVLDLHVTGGAGGAMSGYLSGGGGGGGFVKTRFCDTSTQKSTNGVPQMQNSTSAGITLTPGTINGGAGGGAPATAGGIGYVDNSDIHPMCKAYY